MPHITKLSHKINKQTETIEQKYGKQVSLFFDHVHFGNQGTYKPFKKGSQLHHKKLIQDLMKKQKSSKAYILQLPTFNPHQAPHYFKLFSFFILEHISKQFKLHNHFVNHSYCLAFHRFQLISLSTAPYSLFDSALQFLITEPWHFKHETLNNEFPCTVLQNLKIFDYLQFTIYYIQMQGEGGDYEKQLEKEMKAQQQQQYRQSILTQILTPEARERLSKIKLVKPEKVAGIENSLIGAAQQGKLRNKISENELVSMLENQTKTQNKITFKRRGIDDQW